MAEQSLKDKTVKDESGHSAKEREALAGKQKANDYVKGADNVH